MREFRNITEVKNFCKENNIFFLNTDKKQDLLDRISNWDLEIIKAREAKKNKPRYLSSYEFGQLNRLSKGDIEYLKRKFKDDKHTRQEWIDICRENKVID